MMTTLSLIFPCYNEREGIAHLLTVLEEVQASLGQTYQLELIFVDDGSTDGTAQRLEAELASGRFNARVIRHERNRGLGAAIRTGFAQATGELVATTDSDCTYDPRELVPMLRLIEQGADVVVGSAYHPLGAVHNVPAYRLVLSRNLSRLYNLVLGTRIYTYTSLMRLYRAEVIRTVRFESNEFLAVAEILVNALRAGYRVAEHPMPLTVRQYGSSKAMIVRMINDHARFLLRLLRERVSVAPTKARSARPEGSDRPLGELSASSVTKDH